MVKVAEVQKTLDLIRADVDFVPIGKEFVSSFVEGRTAYDELALIFEVPTSYIGREVSYFNTEKHASPEIKNFFV